MSSQFTPVAMATTGVAINAVYQLRHERDPFPTLFIGAVWVGVIVAVDSMDQRLGTALAAVYLLAVVLTRGSALFDFLSAIAGGVSAGNDKTKRSRQKKKVKP